MRAPRPWTSCAGPRPVIVVDASVLADFLLGRREATEVIADAFREDADQPLHAPEVVEPETLNALRRLVQLGRLGRSAPRRPSPIWAAHGW